MSSDSAVWDKIRRTGAELGRAHVRVGVVGAAATEPHGDSGADNAEIALWMEYGARALPERSFLRKTLDDPAVLAELEPMQAALVGQALLGQISRDEVLTRIGEWLAEKVRRTILDDKVEPALAAATVLRKGSAKVLVDSEALVDAIGYEIVK